MNTVFLSLGTNLGNKEKNLLTAISLIRKRIGSVKAQSAFLQTDPWGFSSENAFLNAAIKVETELTPFKLLMATQSIEREMGRTEKSEDGAYLDRIIDIDILYYYKEGQNVYASEGIRVETTELTLPHPLIKLRDFVLVPLSQIK